MREVRRVSLILTVLFGVAACDAQPSEAAAQTNSLNYQVDYIVTPRPDDGIVDVRMIVTQTRNLLREVRIPSGSPRFTDFDSDGNIVETGGARIWTPPAQGGELRWSAQVENSRKGGGYDALLTDEWGVFRAEDIIPRAATRTLKGAEGDTRMRFELAPGWSAVTQYRERNDEFRVSNPIRRFDQPTGWIAIGDIGVRRDTIAGSRIAIAGPAGFNIRRQDMLALLNWTLPELARIFSEAPPRITVVSAGDPMWRGGLSGPQSIFIHADRPLISENATSTLLHEIMHVALTIRTRAGYDWIVEGLAEFYALELLHRSGTISERRYEQAHATQADWSDSAGDLCGDRSSGATTAHAVAVFRALDAEIDAATDGSKGLDDVLRALNEFSEPIDLAVLTDQSQMIIGSQAETLVLDMLPGCRKIEQ